MRLVAATGIGDDIFRCAACHVTLNGGDSIGPGVDALRVPGDAVDLAA